MNFLQIWIGKKPNKKILKCMETVIDKVTDNDTYTLISNKNFLSKIKTTNIDWINIEEYEFKMMKSNKIIKMIIEFCRLNDNHFYRSCRSDLIRLWEASRKNNLFYLDTDVELKKIPDFINNKIPYIAGIKRKRKIKKDYFIIYNNNNKKFFKELLSEIVNQCYYPRRKRLIRCEINRMWIYNELQYKDKTMIIDNINFKHLNMYQQRKDK